MNTMNSQYAFIFIVFRDMRQEFSTETLCPFLVVNGGVCHMLGEFVNHYTISLTASYFGNLGHVHQHFTSLILPCCS